MLAVGLEQGSDALEQVLALAVECDAAAVVVKAYGSSVEAIRSAGARHRVSVLVARENADWTTIATLARTAVLRAVADLMTAHDYHRDETVEAIKSHDDLHGTEYLPTLRAYLAANGSVSKVGEILHVHKNTVRYRISRLTDAFGLEFGDADTWLWLRLVMKSTEHDA